MGRVRGFSSAFLFGLAAFLSIAQAIGQEAEEAAPVAPLVPEEPSGPPAAVSTPPPALVAPAPAVAESVAGDEATKEAALLAWEARLAEKEVELAGREKAKAPPADIAFLGRAGLLKYGVTFGVGLAVHVPMANIGTMEAQQEGAAASVMPYVTIAPLMWGLGNITRHYCAIKGAVLSGVQAQQGADEYAESLARWRDGYGLRRAEQSIEVEAARRRKKEAEFDAARATWQLKKKELEAAEAAGSAIEAQRAELETAKKAKDEKEVELESARDLEEAKIEEKNEFVSSKTGWDPGLPGTCWWRMIGLYVGYPLMFDANFRVTAEDTSFTKLSVQPIGSFGFSFVPVPYVSLLLGVTPLAATVPDGAGENAPSHIEHSLAWTFAIGANFDIFKDILSFK